MSAGEVEVEVWSVMSSFGRPAGGGPSTGGGPFQLVEQRGQGGPSTGGGPFQLVEQRGQGGSSTGGYIRMRAVDRSLGWMPSGRRESASRLVHPPRVSRARPPSSRGHTRSAARQPAADVPFLLFCAFPFFSHKCEKREKGENGKKDQGNEFERYNGQQRKETKTRKLRACLFLCCMDAY